MPRIFIWASLAELRASCCFRWRSWRSWGWMGGGGGGLKVVTTYLERYELKCGKMYEY